MNISQLLVPVPALQQVLDSAVAEIHQDLDRRAQDILHLTQRARFAARLKELMGFCDGEFMGEKHVILRILGVYLIFIHFPYEHWLR